MLKPCNEELEASTLETVLEKEIDHNQTLCKLCTKKNTLTKKNDLSKIGMCCLNDFFRVNTS